MYSIVSLGVQWVGHILDHEDEDQMVNTSPPSLWSSMQPTPCTPRHDGVCGLLLILAIEYVTYLQDRGQQVCSILHCKEERKGGEEDEEQPPIHPLSCNGVHDILLILNLASRPPLPVQGQWVLCILHYDEERRSIPFIPPFLLAIKYTTYFLFILLLILYLESRLSLLSQGWGWGVECILHCKEPLLLVMKYTVYSSSRWR
jgi:hypothetical protein